MQVHPFRIDIAGARIEDLHRRLDATRWPVVIDETNWREGASTQFMRHLARYWRNSYDWRGAEARLNALPNYKAQIGGLDVHFVHRPGTGPAPMPLIITHGWPGSIVEMERIIPLLTNPGAHGGDPNDAFHVVAPSLPGYGFSQAPTHTGYGPHQIAAMWNTLMAGLGYSKYAAQGGDWGASVSSWLAHRFPENTVGLHLNWIPSSYRPPLGDGFPAITAEEQAFLNRTATWADAEGAYGRIQATKPLSLGYGLTDSPIGLAAWIIEKFQAWSDCDGDIERSFTLDALLTNISLYWFNDGIEATLRLYLENRQRPVQFPDNTKVTCPVGVALFPKELPLPPRTWVERCFNVTRWTEMPHGGHFAAMEVPELLAEDIRAFFRPLRAMA